MAKASQLTISVENRPGTLARVAQALGSAKVNIVGFLTGTSGAQGFVQVVVEDVNSAKKALDKAGLAYREEAVVHAEIPNTPGALGEFASKLAAQGINVTSGYATTTSGAKSASVVLAVSDVEKAARIR